MAKFKNAFTLAEVLIVLAVIGVLATLTLPGVISNTNSRQKVAAFRKAYTNLSNAYSTEFTYKAGPTSNSNDDLGKLFDALNNNLNVKGYYKASDSTYTATTATAKADALNYWIAADDGIAYLISQGGDNCATKLAINGTPSAAATDSSNTTSSSNATCFSITIDTDGILHGNNTLNTDSVDHDNVTGDRMTVFVATNGITSGHPDYTAAGRILGSDN